MTAVVNHSHVADTIEHSRSNSGMGNLVRWPICLFLFSLVLDGPLRYGLNLVGLYPLIYAPKLLLIVSIPILLAMTGRISKGFLLIAVILAIFWGWGVINLSNPAQATFGVWVLAPLIYGLFVARYVLSELGAYRKIIFWLFVTTATGVLLNPFCYYPWVGQTVNFSGFAIDVSHQWTTLTFDRYTGFSRASFSAASQLLVLAIWLVIDIQRWRISLLIWLVAGVGIVLTTSKGPLGAYLLLTAYFMSGKLLRHGDLWRHFWSVVLSAIVSLMVALPISSIIINYNISYSSFINLLLFASFGARLIWMWPDSLGLLREGWHWFVGRGIGGIGAPQQYFDPTQFRAGDNLFVYLTVDFGFLFTLVVLMLLVAMIVRLFIRNSVHPVVFPLALFIFSYGIVSNVVEGSMLSFMLGIISYHPINSFLRKLTWG